VVDVDADLTVRMVALPHRAAVTYIRSQAGLHFDPKVVEAFLQLENIAAWNAPQRD
jgi:response regulator RpfG family c-di-GMP phosphodiesterase